MSQVLIIEEDPMVAAVIISYLEKIGGIKVIGPFTKQEEILKVIATEKIELILMVVYLKEKNGLMLLRDLRLNEYEGDVVMITSAHTASEIKKAYAYGAMDYLIKPFTYERLKGAILRHQKRSYYLQYHGHVTQEGLDDLMAYRQSEMTLPKGLNRHTLERVVSSLKENTEKVWTLRELASIVGVSNVTIKKYMDYLEANEIVSVVMTSGQIGRPEHQYHLLGAH